MKIYTFTFFLLISSLAQAQIHDLFEREAQYHHFNGTVLVQKSDSILYQNSFGFADDSKLITEKTRFDIGSITKQFTAAGILHLVHEGKISLEDPINDHLGSLSSKRWKKVTIHHLLTHTSGVPSLYQTEQGLDIFFPEESAIVKNELISRFKDAKLLSSPGKEFNYSNSGYILLAAIIEQVSGNDYEEYMTSQIFNRYGLTQTSFERNENTAFPYYGYLPKELNPAPIYSASWFFGAGGVYSNTGDLTKWIQTITSESFLSTELRTAFLSTHTEAGYGYGWQHIKDGIIEHDGGNAGFISFLSFNPSTKELHILLTNRSFEDIRYLGKSSAKIQTLSQQIWDWSSGIELEIHPEIIPLTLENSRFLLPNDQELQITQKSEYLELSISGSNVARIIPNLPLEGNTELEEKMIKISSHLERKKFWKFASYCNDEMKFVSYTGLMRYGFSQMKKQIGGLVTLIPYKINSEHGLLRMVGKEGILDLIIYFDAKGKISGIYERGNYALDTPVILNAYPTGNQSFYLDGFPYGEVSTSFNIEEDNLFIEQLGRTVEAIRIK